MKIQHGNTTHNCFLVFYNMHTTQTRLYNTGKKTHQITCMQHKHVYTTGKSKIKWKVKTRFC